MIKVVIDTNVVVSSVISLRGSEARVFDLAINKIIDLSVSEEILTEYSEVLLRPKFGLTKSQVSSIMSIIAGAATLVKPGRTLSASPDEMDNRFLECVESARADYLITGNKRHFPKNWHGTKVVNAREFIEYITLSLYKS